MEKNGNYVCWKTVQWILGIEMPALWKGIGSRDNRQQPLEKIIFNLQSIQEKHNSNKWNSIRFLSIPIK